jgi:hypothetical protein
MTNSYLDRYHAGRHAEVWEELTALGADVRTPGLLDEARAVAAETMRRAKVNVERLCVLLPETGWDFAAPRRGAPGDLAVLGPPAPAIRSQLLRLADGVGGPLPLSLEAWWLEVGSVSLMRQPGHNGFDQYPDPLVVTPIEDVLEELDEWAGDGNFRSMMPIFPAPIAPDAYHKEGVSGGAQYVILLPNEGADAPLLNMGDEPLPFVQYLRKSFRWGGLPGLSETNTTRPAPIERIAAELLPL